LRAPTDAGNETTHAMTVQERLEVIELALLDSALG
jgi:hypothetical protein